MLSNFSFLDNFLANIGSDLGGSRIVWTPEMTPVDSNLSENLLKNEKFISVSEFVLPFSFVYFDITRGEILSNFPDS